MMMSNPEGIAINIDDDVEFTENDQLTSLIAAIFFAKVSNILLLSVAAICGLTETIGSRWIDYFSPAVFVKEVDMLPRSTLGFIITALIAFAEIKSQEQTGFPFQTHPRATMVSVNSLLVYGLASAAEHVFSADPPSVYAIAARLGRIGSLCIMVGSLALLFYF